MVPTNASGRSSRASRKLDGPSTGVPSTSWPDESIGNPESVVAPMANTVEILQREPDGVHDFVASGADRIRAVLLHALADGGGAAACPSFP